MAQIIGLTGGIASGKSTVATIIKEWGFPVVDADVVAREVVQIGQEAYMKIVEAFGEAILHPDGSLNREKLGHIIFNKEEERKRLNEIVHPAVRERMNYLKNQYISKGYKVVVLDIPLLFESKLTSIVDKTLLVYVEEEVQLKRLMERNQYSDKEAMARIKSQMPLSEKLQMTDYYISNNGTIEETKVQLENLFQDWGII
jgi:dephospho-CoA kinase